MDKKLNVAINGFGRIGRAFLKLAITRPEIKLVAINDLGEPENLAYLLKYDSVYGRSNFEVDLIVEKKETYLLIDREHKVKIYSEKDPKKLPWKELEIDVVVESTGVFSKYEDARLHIKAGAKKVVISAPAKSDPKDETEATVLMGVNDEKLKTCNISSNASCTTNCLAPMVKVLNDKFGVEKGFITTVHAYTSDQNIHDAPHKDLRRARAAAYSIVPTTTGAAKAVGLVLPELAGKLDGCAMRVPIPDGSLTDLTVNLKKEVTKEQINAALKAASENELKGILEYTDEPIVSIDIVGNPHSCIFDSALTYASGTMVKVVGWYDNESGYSNRSADLIERIG